MVPDYLFPALAIIMTGFDMNINDVKLDGRYSVTVILKKNQKGSKYKFWIGIHNVTYKSFFGIDMNCIMRTEWTAI